MSEVKKITGKIVNYNSSFNGTMFFDNEIQKIETNTDIQSGNIIIPGFIDLHCHGGNGFDVMEGSDSIEKMSKYHLSHGTTSIMPTTWTNTFEETHNALEGFNDIYNKNSNILGIHLEGPFINPDKLGAQPNLTQTPSQEFIIKLLKLAKIKIITLAPEIKGMNEFISFLNDLKIKIQFGHSLANYDICKTFMNKYNIGFTHLYNAMSGNNHREPGVLSAALEKSNFAESICDNIHVSEQSIKIAKKCIKGLYAITDSINASGLDDGEYIFAKNNIIKENKSVKIKKDGTLAGSLVTMDQTFKNLVNMNFSIEEAVELTSYNASKYLNIQKIGKIEKGCLSNFLVLDNNLNIVDIYLEGNKVNG